MYRATLRHRLQCVEVCCSVLQRREDMCQMLYLLHRVTLQVVLQWIAACCSVLQRVAASSIDQAQSCRAHVAARCGTLQHVAACCRVLQGGAASSRLRKNVAMGWPF